MPHDANARCAIEGVTEIVEMPNCGHALVIDSGWREVASHIRSKAREGEFVPAGEHVHDNCSEHFEVLDGRIGRDTATKRSHEARDCRRCSGRGVR